MDYHLLLTVGGILALLGFITNCLASLIVCFCIADRLASIIFAVVLLILAVFYFYLGFVSESENASRGLYFFTSLASLAAGIIYFCLTNDWNVSGSYLNHFVIYVIPLAALSSALSLQWKLITSFAFQDVLDSAHLGGGKEPAIYCVMNLLAAFVAALVIPATTATTNDARCGAGIVNSIGVWFLNAIVAFFIGFRILYQNAAPLSGQVDASYDKIAQ